MRIVFLCVANSARSQMAEGLALKILGDDYAIESAGSHPAGSVHPLAIEVMKEIGIDISNQMPKSIDAIILDSVDLIITLCEDEVCPPTPKKIRHWHWPLPDPSTLTGDNSFSRDLFRKVRGELMTLINELPDRLSSKVK